VSGFFRHLSLWMFAVVFSWATVLLAAGPLRALRLCSPFWVFWPASALLGAGMWMAGVPVAACAFVAVVLVVGLFTEIEGWGASRGAAALGSMVALVAAVGTGFGAWCRALKISPMTWMSKWVEPMVVKMKELYPQLDIDLDLIVSQMPSALIIAGLLVLAIAVLSERTWLRFADSQVRPSDKWTDFKVWDVGIYALMLALLAALTRHGIKAVTIVGANVLNVLVVLYFYQGMAIVFKAFDVFRVGALWRVLISFILIFQLAIVVAVVGVADYWLEIRNRLARRPVGPKAEL
jgi:hypothetical protein